MCWANEHSLERWKHLEPKFIPNPKAISLVMTDKHSSCHTCKMITKGKMGQKYISQLTWICLLTMLTACLERIHCIDICMPVSSVCQTKLVNRGSLDWHLLVFLVFPILPKKKQPTRFGLMQVFLGVAKCHNSRCSGTPMTNTYNPKFLVASWTF